MEDFAEDLSSSLPKPPPSHIVLVNIVQDWEPVEGSRSKVSLADAGQGPASQRPLASIEVSVGTGKQSVKWLAAAVEERLKEEGALMSRAGPGVGQGSRFLVSGIYAEDGQAVAPELKLCNAAELVRNGKGNDYWLEVYAKVSFIFCF